MLWLEKNKKLYTKVGTSKFISRFILSLWPPGPENSLNKHNTHQIDLETRSEQGQLSKVTSQGCNPDQGLGERHMAFQSGNYKVRYLVSSTYCLCMHGILLYHTSSHKPNMQQDCANLNGHLVTFLETALESMFAGYCEQFDQIQENVKTTR